MSCPTCSGTMQSLDRQWCWCPRCGTLLDRSLDDTVTNHEAPKLVERCLAFEKLAQPMWAKEHWQSLGIAESIHPPEDRPEHTEEEKNGGDH